MLSSSLFNEVSEVEKVINDSEVVLRAVRKIASNNQLVETTISDLMSGSNSADSDTKQLRNRLHAELSNTIKEISPKDMILGFQNLRDSLVKQQEKLSAETFELDNFLEELDRVADLYEKYLQERSVTTGHMLVKQSVQFTQFIKGFSNGTRVFTRNYESSYQPLVSEKMFTLLLPAEMNLADFITKLMSLDRIYKELCELHEVSQVDFPLRIAKVESGSLWVKIFGETKVIELLTDLVRSFVNYLHRNYTREGKIGAVASNADTIASVLELRERMINSGVDVADLDDQLRKASAVLGKNLNDLLADQRKVVVNGDSLLVNSTSDKRLDMPVETPRIEHKIDDVET